jgi:hypothetical protein
MATPFTFEVVADGIAVGGGEVSLALDKAGNPRIAFSQRDTGQIIVAQRNGGTWTHESVSSGFVGIESSLKLAIDSQGNPQLAYRDLNGGDLIHAVKGATQWSFTHIRTRLTPAGTDDVGEIAFALHPGRLDTESRDVGYFVYRNLTTDGIGFAHTGSLGPTPVTVQVVETRVTTFGGPSTTFDPSEGFFVTYVGFFHTGAPQDSVSIRATVLTDIEKGTFADPAVIDNSPLLNVRRPTSIVRTFSDGCIAYFDVASKTLKASVSSGGASAIETVATNINSVITPSAAVKGADFRIAYADIDGVKLASRSRSGVWAVEVVDAASAGSPSLAYDKSGTANIAYAAGGTLKYARRSE